MLKIEEVFQKTVKEYEENPDGSRRMASRKEYWTRDALINPRYIVAVYDHEFTSSSDVAMLGSLPKGSKFCRIIIDGNSFRSSEIIVASSFSKFASRLEQL